LNKQITRFPLLSLYKCLPGLFAVAGLCLLLFSVSGCAGFFIPAPNSPTEALPAPAIPDSTITVPVSVSVETLLQDIGLPTLNGSNLISRNVRRLLKRQALRNDSRILKSRFVRRQMDEAWNALQRPIQARKDFFLLLNPSQVSLSVLPSEGENIQLVLQLVAKPKLVAGLPALPSRPLPDVALIPAPRETGFHVSLETALPFDLLTAELSKRFEGTPYVGHRESVVIKKIRVYGSGEAVVFAITVKGTVNGTVYLSGNPEYDSSTRSLFIRDLDYTIETKQILKKVADWLAHSEMRESLEKKATWYIGDRIDGAKDTLSTALNRNLNDLVSMSGNIEAIRPVYIGVYNAGLRAVLEADGKAEMRVLN
jgi:hypothetical protein